MEHKNDYSVIAFYPDGVVKKWQFVHGLAKFAVFLDIKHPGWKYFNVYERRTGSYLKRFYPGNAVPRFLALVFLLMSLTAKPDLTFGSPTFNNGFNNTATIPNDAVGKGGMPW